MSMEAAARQWGVTSSTHEQHEGSLGRHQSAEADQRTKHEQIGSLLDENEQEHGEKQETQS